MSKHFLWSQIVNNSLCVKFLVIAVPKMSKSSTRNITMIPKVQVIKKSNFEYIQRFHNPSKAYTKNTSDSKRRDVTDKAT